MHSPRVSSQTTLVLQCCWEQMQPSKDNKQQANGTLHFLFYETAIFPSAVTRPSCCYHTCTHFQMKGSLTTICLRDGVLWAIRQLLQEYNMLSSGAQPPKINR
jgi:hypothetical protein